MNWIQLGGSASGGGISDNAGYSQWSVTAIDSKSHPVVAWSDLSSGAPHIYVKRWTGTKWEALAGIAPGDTSASGAGISAKSVGDSMYPVIAIDHLDNPVVAWPSLQDGTYIINVARWTGAAWTLLQPVEVFTYPVFVGHRPIAMALGPDDRPYIAYVQADTDGYGSEINVIHWNEALFQWEWFLSADGIESGGGVVQAVGYSHSPSMALDARGYPIVAWEKVFEGKFGSEIYVKRWNASAWVGLGGSGSGGGVSNTPSWSSAPSLAAARVYGNGPGSLYLAVAWSDYNKATNQYEIYFRQWDGAAWVEVAGGQPGQTSAAGGGISATPAESQWASLRLDATMRPVVSWMELAPGVSDIFLKQWDGTAWVALGNSASSGGINKTGSVDWSGTSLAVRPGGIYAVSWADTAPGQAETYLRAWYLGKVMLPPDQPEVIDKFDGRAIMPGATLGGDAIMVVGQVNAAGDRTTVSLQVEVRPLGWAFTGVSTAESAFVRSGEQARLVVEGLSPGAYSMRTRLVREDGEASEWTEPGDHGRRPDFVVVDR